MPTAWIMACNTEAEWVRGSRDGMGVGGGVERIPTNKALRRAAVSRVVQGPSGLLFEEEFVR
jgi:hypothetical protein